MQALRQKQEKMDPVVRVRKIQLEQASIALGNIRREKVAKVEQIRRYQREYLQGLEQLNHERMQSQKQKLSVLESSVDFVKEKWQEHLRELRMIEEQERAQLANIVNAQRDLRAVEKLTERYATEIAWFEERREQQVLDELALRKGLKGF